MIFNLLLTVLIVFKYLQCCDYGILIREQSDKSKVESPNKYVEYLYVGLKVIITEKLGDYSDFVEKIVVGILSKIMSNA